MKNRLNCLRVQFAAQDAVTGDFAIGVSAQGQFLDNQKCLEVSLVYQCVQQCCTDRLESTVGHLLMPRMLCWHAHGAAMRTGACPCMRNASAFQYLSYGQLHFLAGLARRADMPGVCRCREVLTDVLPIPCVRA